MFCSYITEARRLRWGHTAEMFQHKPPQLRSGQGRYVQIRPNDVSPVRQIRE